jgi:hypothetical protein
MTSDSWAKAYPDDGSGNNLYRNTLVSFMYKSIMYLKLHLETLLDDKVIFIGLLEGLKLLDDICDMKVIAIYAFLSYMAIYN